MELGPDKISSQGNISVSQLLKKEILADINLFPDELRDFIEQWQVKGSVPSNVELLTPAKDAINKWWQGKYGFPYADKNKVATALISKAKQQGASITENITKKVVVDKNSLEEVFELLEKNKPENILAPYQLSSGECLAKELKETILRYYGLGS